MSYDGYLSVTKETNAEDGVDLRQFIGTLWARKGVILASMLICAAISYAMVSQIPPNYTARAAVILDARSVQVLESTDVVSDLTLNNPAIDSEVTVLRSNLLLQDVLARFSPEALIPIDPLHEPPTLMSRLRGAARGVLNNPDSPDRGAGGDALADPAPVMTEEDRRLRRLTGALRRALTVWREGQSYVISVSIETRDPVLSMRLANTIVDEYIARQVRQRREAVRGANAFLDDRVDVMRAELERAEAAVEDFRRGQLATGGASPESLDRQLIDLSTQIALASAELATAEARARQIRSVVESEGIETAAELLSSPFVLSLREEKSTLELRDLELSSRLGPEHPDRQSIRNALTAVSTSLVDEVGQIIATLENEVAVARIRVGSLTESLARLEARAADLSRASLELRQLEREAQAVRASYEAALIRASETQSIEQLQRADAVLLERATIPGAPSSPRITLFTALGAAIGLSLGLVATIFLALFGAGFSRATDLERATGQPVVVSLPLVRWRTVRRTLQSLRKSPYQPYTEGLRQLRAAISRDGGARCVLITSSIPGEGKTTMAVAFAQLEAMSRHRCILLDFDMRKSTSRADLSYRAAPGCDLAAVLMQSADLEQAIDHDPDRGFDVLAPAQVMPGLADKVEPERIADLISTLRTHYDRVIIDSAPILSVADTLPLVQHVDAIVLLVRASKTTRRAVRETLWRLRHMGGRSINLVFSMADKGSTGYGYGYSYSSGSKPEPVAMERAT